MPEWFKGTVLRTAGLCVRVGSNPAGSKPGILEYLCLYYIVFYYHLSIKHEEACVNHGEWLVFVPLSQHGHYHYYCF